jgi:hypothetical protein
VNSTSSRRESVVAAWRQGEGPRDSECRAILPLAVTSHRRGACRTQSCHHLRLQGVVCTQKQADSSAQARARIYTGAAARVLRGLLKLASGCYGAPFTRAALGHCGTVALDTVWGTQAHVGDSDAVARHLQKDALSAHWQGVDFLYVLKNLNPPSRKIVVALTRPGRLPASDCFCTWMGT